MQAGVAKLYFSSIMFEKGIFKAQGPAQIWRQPIPVVHSPKLQFSVDSDEDKEIIMNTILDHIRKARTNVCTI